MLPFDLLGIRLADRVLCGWQVAFVGAPVVRVKAGDPERRQLLLELQEDFIPAITEGIRENFAGAVIDRMPQPTRMLLVLDVTPHLVQLGFLIFNLLNVNNNFLRI